MIFLRVEILIRNDPDLAVMQYSVNYIIFILSSYHKTW